MGKRLSEAEVARYGRDGFLHPVDAFGRDEASHYLGELESFERRAGHDQPRPRTDYRTAGRAVHAEAVARFREANREETYPTRRHHDRIETATHLAAGADPLPRGRGLYRAPLRPGPGRSSDLYPQRVGRRRQWRQLDVTPWVMCRVMCWRQAALLRRVHPGRRARPPSGAAAAWDPAGLALAMLLCLAVTGCADPGRTAQEDRPGGFYGGASGGMTRR